MSQSFEYDFLCEPERYELDEGPRAEGAPQEAAAADILYGLHAVSFAAVLIAARMR